MENNLPLHLEESLLKITKLGILTLALLLLPLILGACGGVSLGSPESAAESFYKAVEGKNEDNLKDIFCSDLESNVEAFAARFDNEDFEYDYDFDVEFHKKDEDAEDDVDVEVYGRVKVRIVSDDSDLEVKLASRGDAPLFDIHLTKDGDDWKICDASALNNLEPFPTE